MKKNNKNALISILLAWFFSVSILAYAATPSAGTLIQNQASATYRDSGGTLQFATSNIVETLIQQVASLDLISDQSKNAISSSSVSFPHVLTNTGNDGDTYTINLTNLTGDDFDYTTINAYPDQDRDGVADSTTPISDTGLLAAGESFYFVVIGEIPSGQTVASTADLQVQAVSQFNATVQATNTDTVTITDQAVIEVTKRLSVSEGYSPSGPYTVTLTYQNNGSQTASDVTLIDALPAGMTYVANSGEWSFDAALTLTDNDPADSQGTASTIIYCAYDVSCTGLTKGAHNTGADSTTQLTAIIASVQPGESGTISFEVNIDSALQAQTLINTAEFEYNNGTTAIGLADTNQTPFTILPTPGVVANGSTTNSTDGVGESVTVASASPGGIVNFDNIIWNTGNAEDTFEVVINNASSTFPPGTVFQLFKSDGFTPLLDTDGDATPDTGPVSPGNYYTVVLKAFLPVGISGNAGYDITKQAISSLDDTVSNTITDRLNEIIAETVDLTNDIANTLGAGNDTAQTITTPATTRTVSPGDQAVFLLNVNNGSTEARDFQLQYSKDKPFVSGSLEAGWTAAFHLDGGAGDCSSVGAQISSTGSIPGSGSKQLCAVVTTPADAVGSSTEYPIYFRVFSAANNAEDIKFDAVIIAEQPSLQIEPDQHANIEPGGTTVYSHRIFNPGNTALECINVSTSNTTAGWNSVVYHDVNENSVLDSADTLLADQTLAVGDSFQILVKMFAPANANLGDIDTTQVTVTGKQDDGAPGTCNGSTLTDNVTDTTTVSNANVNIVKMQALDAGCDGTADSSYTASTFAVSSGGCVMYRLTANNAGSTPVNNVRIDDAAPVFTAFFGTSISTHGNIQGGLVGQDGSISAGSVGGAAITLQSGESMTLDFSVKLD